MTKDEVWDPSKYDTAPSADADWFAALADSTLEPIDGTAHLSVWPNSLLFDTELLNDHNNISVFGAKSTLIPRDYESLGPYFLGMPTEIVRLTYAANTQYYSNYSASDGQVHIYKSPFPAANVFRCDEDVSTDTLHADIPAWGGFTCMQLFAGTDSHYIHTYIHT